MNASQFMDKQIMDLKTSSSSSSSFIDLMSNDDTETNNNNKINLNKKEEKELIVPSYDFHPIRPLSSSLNLDSSAHSLSSSLPKYASLQVPIEPAKAAADKDFNASDSSILLEIDKTMKKHADNLLLVLEGVSSRLTQLETRTRHLETSVDDLKVSVGNNHGSTDGKMRQLENILLEVQTGVHVLKDKQGIMETQLQLTKLHMSKENQQESESHYAGGTDVIQQGASAPPHPPHHLTPPVTFPASIPSVPAPLPTVPPPMPQQNLAPPAPVGSQFHQSQLTPVPNREPYYQTPGQTQESPNPPYVAASSQQPQPQPQPQAQGQIQPPPAVPQHQPYSPAPQPQFPQPPQQLQPQPALVHHPEEAPYMQTQNYTPSLSQPSSHAPISAPQQYYGPPTQMYEPPVSRPSSGFSTGYFPQSGGHNEPFPYSRPPSQYASTATVKAQHSGSLAQGGGSGYPQLPTARILPQALPTASGVSSGSSSPSSGNRVPLDDVIDKVTNMGFSREQVRATVRKLTENGQAVDLNIVLDKLMNDGDIQPQRGWFGR